jgi:hypothetical protein
MSYLDKTAKLDTRRRYGCHFARANTSTFETRHLEHADDIGNGVAWEVHHGMAS